MRSALAYSPRPGPLVDASALAATTYLGSFALVAFVFSNPIVLAGAGVAVAVAGIASGATRALLLALRWGAALAILIVAVNAIASQRGDTIIVRGWDPPVLGQIDVSGEAIVEGAVLALRIVVVMMAFFVHTARVDPDRVMRLVRPVARHSAMTATLLARLVPLAAADYARLGEAARLRGPGAEPVGRGAIARRLVAGSLDRSVDVAGTLELRGYAHGAPRMPGPVRRSRYSARFAVCGAAVAALSIAARVAGVGGFESYPTVTIDLDAATLVLAAAIPALAAVPFAPGRMPARRVGWRGDFRTPVGAKRAATRGRVVGG
jgi:energy-coupling factor transporter transmembrane protein EcfT